MSWEDLLSHSQLFDHIDNHSLSIQHHTTRDSVDSVFEVVCVDASDVSLDDCHDDQGFDFEGECSPHRVRGKRQRNREKNREKYDDDDDAGGFLKRIFERSRGKRGERKEGGLVRRKRRSLGNSDGVIRGGFDNDLFSTLFDSPEKLKGKRALKRSFSDISNKESPVRNTLKKKRRTWSSSEISFISDSSDYFDKIDNNEVGIVANSKKINLVANNPELYKIKLDTVKTVKYYWHLLPKELLKNIFGGLLSSFDLNSVGSVCQNWHQASVDNMLWKMLFKEFWSAKIGMPLDEPKLWKQYYLTQQRIYLQNNNQPKHYGKKNSNRFVKSSLSPRKPRKFKPYPGL
eukprot:TRINITY_DN2633_c0_g6_i1.p1 TRINITY_DN2633_c0_g6~~TRINITY_DN2633_c0_g6_i1.p1  ORF type:complete len:345 (-),score=72.64 TRINITY_DN2633_c0_g6_i1:38-1072(-)